MSCRGTCHFAANPPEPLIIERCPDRECRLAVVGGARAGVDQDRMLIRALPADDVGSPVEDCQTQAESIPKSITGITTMRNTRIEIAARCRHRRRSCDAASASI